MGQGEQRMGKVAVGAPKQANQVASRLPLSRYSDRAFNNFAGAGAAGRVYEAPGFRAHRMRKPRTQFLRGRSG